jgi:hypothetical protein
MSSEGLRRIRQEKKEIDEAMRIDRTMSDVRDSLPPPKIQGPIRPWIKKNKK